MTLNILFLDYDGVVNIPMWSNDGKRCRYNSPSDNAVNNFQACQWISELCEKYDYKIVVTSTWRFSPNYKECLYNGGLRDTVKVIGRVISSKDGNREHEIQQFLDEHQDIDNFIIIDDDIIKGFNSHFVKCRTDCGFNQYEFSQAVDCHKSQELRKQVNNNEQRN